MSELVPLTGEPLALDLVNTRPAGGDLLAAPEDLRAWVEMEADRLPDPPERYTSADLDAVHAVRGCAARALEHARHGTRPVQADLDALNRAQRAAPAISAVEWSGEGLALIRRRSGPPGERLAARLAEAAAELLADPAVAGVRQCEADDCVLLFLPAHPRRRWCSAARCGNRVRVARHYQRHRAR
ncbi:CGNR zinc finger domain-containing protein [Nocardiopsis potens]|uniref:CGNR zinc finger domain-containing protein n=1 Tax=Nocardiopsis potens TaxID=1246458 RepID=UPI000344D162|nr:ABATE domain-containing protein [Nocardiopsis potens]